MRMSTLTPILSSLALLVTAAGCGSSTKTTIECPQGSPNTCGSGATQICTDLRIDEANCGACGHACGLGKSCVASACVAACAWTSHQIQGVDSSSVTYTGSGTWVDNMVRAYVNPGATLDITGWVKFDLSSIPASALVALIDLNMNATTLTATPNVEVQHSTGISWTRATATSTLVPRGTVVAPARTLVAGWNSFGINVNAHDFAADLVARALTLGVTNTNTVYSYAYFDGTDNVATRPYLHVLTCE